MSFLSKAELKTVKVVGIIDIITNTTDDTVDEIIAEQISLFKDKLRNHYDTDAIFEATGDNRSKTVLRYLKHVVVYDLFNIRSAELPPAIEKNYDEAMRWLDDVEKGKGNPDLPRPTNEEGVQDTFLQMGSRTKYSSRW